VTTPSVRKGNTEVNIGHNSRERKTKMASLMWKDKMWTRVVSHMQLDGGEDLVAPSARPLTNSQNEEGR